MKEAGCRARQFGQMKRNIRAVSTEQIDIWSQREKKERQIFVRRNAYMKVNVISNVHPSASRFIYNKKLIRMTPSFPPLGFLGLLSVCYPFFLA